MCAHSIPNRVTPFRVLAMYSHDSNRLSIQLIMGWLLFSIIFTSLVTGCNRTMAQEAPMPTLPETAASESAASDASQPASDNMHVQIQVEVNSNGEGKANAAGWANGSGNAKVRVEASGPEDSVAKAYAGGGGDAQAEVETNGPGVALAEIISDEQSALPAPALFRSAAPKPTLAPTETDMQKYSTQANPSPQAKVVSELVNLRQGPGVTYPIIGQASLGQEFMLVATTATRDWWKICCYQTQTAWIVNDYVEITGNTQTLDNIMYLSPPAPATSVPSPTPTVVEQPTPASNYDFDLVLSEQFAESITPRVFLYVYEGDFPKEGYSLHVVKDGIHLPVTLYSFGGQPSYTWPLPIERQRLQNLKFEFPGVPIAGTWVVSLADRGGNIVGPPATFVMQPDDPRQEMYVRYQKR